MPASQPGMTTSGAAQESSTRAAISAQFETDDYELVAEHRTGTHRPVRLVLTDQETSAFFTGVQLSLVVDVNGNVFSAAAVQGPERAFSPAIAEAKTWKYKPFEKDGEPVVARITDYVSVLPPEDLPKTHQEFPRLASPAGVIMTLSRTACLGTCPAYRVEIRGDGTVLYHGESFVVVEGDHRDHISEAQVEEIVEAFRNADYFSLKDEYKYLVTDNPTFTTSFEADHLKKAVTDYVGPAAGMPQAASNLELAIDRVADTAKWVRGNADTVASLKKEGWDFKSVEAAKTMARAAQEGSADFVRDLLQEGTHGAAEDEAGNSPLAAAAQAGDRKTLEMLMKAGVGKNDAEIKTKALGAAALEGDLEMVKELIVYGGDPKGVSVGEFREMTVLMAAATSSVPQVVETILAVSPDVNAKDERGHTAVWYVTQGNSYWDAKRHANRGQVIHLLARAGANLNAQDDDGDAALHRAYYEDVAKALIDEGADVNIRNNDGDTPLMRNFSVAAAKLLIAAGADVQAKNHEGRTALDLAKQVEPDGERVKFLQSVMTSKEAPKRN
jgi:ankyrin repeat protein